ncbi:MAG: hypothetical protein WC180_06980 [Candidatus Paceibacterota bacterium]
MLELLFDTMISRTGHIANALLSIKSKRTWITYFKAIQKGRFSWLKLVQRWVQLLLKLFGNLLPVVLDDFITVRTSKKASSVAFHHDHAKRANRPKFLWGQLRVSLGIICFRKGKVASLPLMMRLIRTKGNTSKLQAAEMMQPLLFK